MIEEMSRTIVVFTSGLNHGVRRGIGEIDKNIEGLSWLILVHSPRRTVKHLVCNQLKNIRRNGIAWIPYQTWDIVKRWMLPAPFFSEQAPGYVFSAQGFNHHTNVRIEYVDDLNSASVLGVVRAACPILGLSLGAPILKEGLFAIPRFGTLNLHKGRLPDYRGMPPSFWEMWNDEQEVGCTVHWVSSKLDAGDIVKEATVLRQPFSTLKGMQLTLETVGIRLMRDAVRDVLSGRATAAPQPVGGVTYRKPTLSQRNALESKLARHTPEQESLIKRHIKNAIFLTAVVVNRLLLQHFRPSRVTVLLYHRVADDVRDNLTVGIEQFDKQIAFLARHYKCISIDEVLRMRTQIPCGNKPLVCVTFDDGYLDNYENAAQTLLRHGVPAAFFVTTGLMGTHQRFPHDVARGNPELPLMNWDQLREMVSQGFVIGSHTVSHIDCATEADDIVEKELQESRDTLGQELGLKDVIFAYPYGGRSNMTETRLELVKRAGYRACLSAYGGVNVASVDEFNVLRSGIHWEFSIPAMMFKADGLR